MVDSVFKNNSVFNCGTGTTRAALETSTTTSPGVFTFENNIFYGNAGFAFKATAAGAPTTYINRNNAYGSNAGTGASNADLNNFPYGAGDVTAIGNPFVSSTDFGLNATAGAGALCRGVAAGAPNASANTAGDLGAIPSGGGGSGTSGATAFAF